MLRVAIFFSLAEPPLNDPTPTRPNTPRQSRKGHETDRNGAETEPKRSRNEAKRTRNQALWGGKGGVSGLGGGGDCKGRRKSLA